MDGARRLCVYLLLLHVILLNLVAISALLYSRLVLRIGVDCA